MEPEPEPPGLPVVDGAAGAAKICEQIVEMVNHLDSRAPMPPLERIEAFQHARATHDALGVVLSQLESDAIEAMTQLDVDEINTPVGPVHVETGKPSDRWRGYELLGELADTVVERGTGEIVDAVRVDVIRAVVAGCDAPDKEYGKFLVGGLDRHCPGWQRFRSKGDTPPSRLKPGPSKRKRRKRPTHPEGG